MRGKFIVFEGIDGSGKSTQQKVLEETLKKEGHKVFSTYEPTDSPMGKMIREVFRGEIRTNHQTIAALFLADRLDHLQNETSGILKKLKEGYIVVSDRYYFSSYAYHGVHMPLEWVIEINKVCSDLLRPDLNLFIDIDPAVSMERLKASRENIELYETLSNLEAVREKYLESFERLGEQEKIVIIDGNQNVGEVSHSVWKSVEEVISVESGYQK